MRMFLILLLAGCLTQENAFEKKVLAECRASAACNLEESERPRLMEQCREIISNFNARCDLTSFCTWDLEATRACIEEYDWQANMCTTGEEPSAEEREAHDEAMRVQCAAIYSECDYAKLASCEEG